MDDAVARQASSSALASAGPNAAPRGPSATSRARASRRRSEVSSEGVGSDLAGADARDALDGHDPHLAVADLAGAGRADERLGDPGDVAVIDEDLEAHLRHEVDLVPGAPVTLGV